MKAHLPLRSVMNSTGWMLIGLSARMGFQLLAFILLAQALGPESFGAFAGTLALVTLLSPFVEWGGYSLIVQDIAAGVPTKQTVGNSLLLALLMLPLGLGTLALLKLFILPQVAWSLVLALGLAEFLGGRLFWLACGAHVAHEMLWRNALLEVFWGVLRLLMVCWFVGAGGDLALWGNLFLLQALVMGVVAMGWVVHTWGFPSAKLTDALSRIRPGWHFAVGQAAQNIYTDVDKVMLARLATLEATGIYAAAYRFIPLAYLPLNALMSALYPRFFKAGLNRTTRTLALETLWFTAGYGILATTALWLSAPYLPLVFGSGFRESVETLKLLAFIPLIQGLYSPFADALTGSGRQVVRTRGQLAALGINILLNLWLIPGWGWAGAAWATIVSQLLLLAIFGWAVLQRKQ
jgi:O-antigen/teichoic acid export membrane protein